MYMDSDKVEEKKKMWKLCNRNHRETDINSNADGVSNVTLNARGNHQILTMVISGQTHICF